MSLSSFFTAEHNRIHPLASYYLSTCSEFLQTKNAQLFSGIQNKLQPAIQERQRVWTGRQSRVGASLGSHRRGLDCSLKC